MLSIFLTSDSYFNKIITPLRNTIFFLVFCSQVTNVSLGTQCIKNNKGCVQAEGLLLCPRGRIAEDILLEAHMWKLVVLSSLVL